MAHIPDGVLSAPVLIGGAVLAAGGIVWALRNLDGAAIPKAGIMAAVFFAGSLLAVPIGPSTVHLIFAGLMGILLGPVTFAAVLVALLLQASMFGFGGITTLGINTFNIAAPAVLAGLIARPILARTVSTTMRSVVAACAGGGAIAGTALLVSLSFALSGSEYTPIASVMAVTYIPLGIVEAAITAATAGFLSRVQPSALPA